MPGQYLAHTWCKKAIPTPNTTTTTHTHSVCNLCAGLELLRSLNSGGRGHTHCPSVVLTTPGQAGSSCFFVPSSLGPCLCQVPVCLRAFSQVLGRGALLCLKISPWGRSGRTAPWSTQGEEPEVNHVQWPLQVTWSLVLECVPRLKACSAVSIKARVCPQSKPEWSGSSALRNREQGQWGPVGFPR